MYQLRIALCVKNNNKRIEFSTGNVVYFFYNFIRYKIFLSATYQVVLLHSVIYSETLVGWSPMFLGHLGEVMRCLATIEQGKPLSCNGVGMLLETLLLVP
jgi:hypothetical protein